jgi:serine/threonine-protein kinase
VTLQDDLRRRSQRRERFTKEDFVRVLNAVSGALVQAHERGVIHRDLKPANIMLETKVSPPSNGVKLLDFGVAKLVGRDLSDATTRGRMLGSIPYMAPEQWLGADVTAASDVFSWACVIFEVLTLRKCWVLAPDGSALAAEAPVEPKGHNVPSNILDRMLAGRRADLRSLRPDLPAELDAVLSRALSGRPDDRHAGVNELLLELNSCLESKTELIRPDLPTRASTAPRPIEPRGPGPRGLQIEPRVPDSRPPQPRPAPVRAMQVDPRHVEPHPIPPRPPPRASIAPASIAPLRAAPAPEVRSRDPRRAPRLTVAAALIWLSVPMILFGGTYVWFHWRTLGPTSPLVLWGITGGLAWILRPLPATRSRASQRPSRATNRAAMVLATGAIVLAAAALGFAFWKRTQHAGIEVVAPPPPVAQPPPRAVPLKPTISPPP